jgi:hypothetical protein
MLVPRCMSIVWALNGPVPADALGAVFDPQILIYRAFDQVHPESMNGIVLRIQYAKRRTASD